MERLSLSRWASPWLRHQHLVRYQWAAAYSKGRKVLDAACGTGYGTAILLRSGALSVDGLDRSGEAIEEARNSHPPPGVRYWVGDVTRLPFRGETYDTYVCFETLEHVEDDVALVREAVRVLRPGGTFLCSTPNRSVISPGHTIEHRPSNPFHTREYALDEVMGLLGSFFATIEVFGQTWFPREYIERLNRLGRRLPTVALRLHQLRKILGLLGQRSHEHQPATLRSTEEPEVFIAVCRS